LFTLPGATELTIVSLYGEISPIEVFKKPSQLVAFAGLDPKVFQFGQFAFCLHFRDYDGIVSGVTGVLEYVLYR